MKLLPILLLLLQSAVSIGQVESAIDFIAGDISIQLRPREKQLNGRVRYSFHVARDTNAVGVDAAEMRFGEVKLNGKRVDYEYDGSRINIRRKLRAGKNYELNLEYTTTPKQSVYFLGWDDDLLGNEQVWTQGQGKYSSHWVPSFDDMKEKVIFGLDISVADPYEIAANGKLEGTYEQEGGMKLWRFRMQRPMSSYLLAFVVGNYRRQERVSDSGIPLHLYYYPQDSLKAEPTYRYSRRIFNYLESQIGVPYPWGTYRQVPVRDFLYAGMENTACTIFSDGYVIDSIAFKDRNYVNINAHELAHQWFGNLVTEKSGAHHWLHEGFATYFAYLTEKELFGDEYFHWRLFETARALDRMSEQGGGEALTDPGAGSLTFYEKGAWALYMLHETVGDAAFRAGIKSFLERFAFRNARVEDFLAIMESSSGQSLKEYESLWLNSNTFPYPLAIDKLAAFCPSLDRFLQLQAELTASTQPNEPIIEHYWKTTPSEKFRVAVLGSYYNSLSERFINNALADGGIMVRQAIALESVQIPPTLKNHYESLLDDASYTTMEAALYKLWIYFDDDRHTYLERCRNVIGFPNRNVRLLWLTLALLSPGFEDENKPKYFDELSGYTSQEHGFETRQLAFQYLKEAFRFTDDNIKDLIGASVHPSWQFRSYARTILNDLLADAKYLARIKNLQQELNEEELRYIKQKLMPE
jgi:aminopeptidase N